MTLTEQVYAQARIMAPELSEENQAVLEAVCRSVVVSLTGKLREPLTPEDCRADFIAAAGMFAVAAMSEVGQLSQVEQMVAGDLTVRRSSGNAAASCLRSQAQMLIGPYLKPAFVFLGV